MSAPESPDVRWREQEARRLVATPSPHDNAMRALSLAEAQVCATLAVADAISELARVLCSRGSA